MARPVTLFTGQWADLPLEELAAQGGEWGYDGLELACWGDHFEVDEALARRRLLPRQARAARAPRPATAGRSATTSSARPCATRSTSATRASCPPDVWGDGDPEGVRQRAAEEMKDTARAAAAARRRAWSTASPARRSGTCSTRSRPTTSPTIERGYEEFAERWNPILDVFDAEGVRFALEVHPTEIAYDFVTTRKTLEAIGRREGFGFNFDPSHFAHQFVDSGRVRRASSPTASTTSTSRTRCKRLDGRRSILGSHLDFGEPGAAGTSSRPATATWTSRTSSARSTGSATRGRSRSSGRTPAWTATGARRRRWQFVRRTDFAPSDGGLRRRLREGGLSAWPRRRSASSRWAGAARRRRGDDRRRHARLRLHGQGPRERLQEDPLHGLAAAATCRELVAIAGPQRGGGVRGGARYGFEGYVTDWQRAAGRRPHPAVRQLGPNNLHAEPSIAAAEAGKHVICEKPLGRDAAESYDDLAARRRRPA